MTLGIRTNLHVLQLLRPGRVRVRAATARTARRQLPPPYLKLLRRAYGIEIWLVDGEWVRLNVDPNFAQASHGLVNPDIPQRQIWIDSGTSRREWPLWELHELLERRLMARGHSYNEAHQFAIAAELKYRAHPRGLAAALRAERGC